MKPKLVIIGGGVRCGTTSLFRDMVEIGKLRPSFIKQTNYLLKDEITLSGYLHYFRGYTGAKDERIIEASPDYLYSDQFRVHLEGLDAEFDIYLIFIFRDPVERLRSWLIHNEYAVPSEDEILSDSIYEEGLRQGLYGRHLQSIFSVHDRVHVVDFNSYTTKKKQELEKIFAFLNEDADFSNWDSTRVYNRGREVSSSALRKVYNSLRRVGIRLSLLGISPRLLRKMASPVRNLYKRVNTVVASKGNMLGTKLETYYASDVKKLQSMGYELSWMERYLDQCRV